MGRSNPSHKAQSFIIYNIIIIIITINNNIDDVTFESEEWWKCLNRKVIIIIDIIKHIQQYCFSEESVLK